MWGGGGSLKLTFTQVSSVAIEEHMFVRMYIVSLITYSVAVAKMTVSCI